MERVRVCRCGDLHAVVHVQVWRPPRSARAGGETSTQCACRWGDLHAVCVQVGRPPRSVCAGGETSTQLHFLQCRVVHDY